MPPKKKDLRTRVLTDGTLKLSIPSFIQTRGERVERLKYVLCDVKLQMGPDKHFVEAHRDVLKAEIPYFNAMFSGNFQESTQEVIDLPDIEDTTAVRKLVNLFYNGYLTVTPNDVQDVFVVCDIWGLEGVKRKCADFMIQELDCFNCFDLSCLGEMYSHQEMVDASHDLISREFQIISKLEYFVDLPAEVLISLVQRKDFNLGHSGENCMVEAVTKWLRHDWPQRQQYLDKLMPHLKYSLCSRQVRDDFINLCPETIREVVENHLIPYTHSELDWIWLPEDCEPYRKRKENIMVFCGYSHTRSGPTSPKIKTVELFNLDTQQTLRSVDLPETPSYGVAFNLMGRIVYFAVIVHTDASTNKHTIKSQVYTFRPEQPVPSNMYRTSSNIFSKEATDCITRCLTSKGCVVHCPINNRIYAVSIQNVDCLKVKCSNGEIICEHEKPLQNLKAILFGENYAGMSCVCHKGQLYVIGGNCGPLLQQSYSKDVFVLSEDGTSWKEEWKMCRSRTNFAVVSDGRKMVVSGGYGGLTNLRRLLNCEGFIPNDGTWWNFPSLKQSRTHHCMVVANGQLYAIGGKTYSSQKLSDETIWLPGGARIVSNVIEKYVHDTLSWERFGKMKKGRCMFSAIAV